MNKITSSIVSVAGCLCIIGLTTAGTIKITEDMKDEAKNEGYQSGFSIAERRNINALDNLLDTESNQFGIKNALKNKDQFTRLSEIIESAEPPVVRPAIWEVISNRLLAQDQPILAAINDVLKRFKLTTLPTLPTLPTELPEVKLPDVKIPVVR